MATEAHSLAIANLKNTYILGSCGKVLLHMIEKVRTADVQEIDGKKVGERFSERRKTYA